MANKTEKEIFPFLSRTVEVHRRAFRRSVSVHLYPRKSIKVVAGILTSKKVIYDFLLTKKDWIEKNLSKFDELVAQFPEKKIRSYEVFPLMGQSLNLRMALTVLKKPFVAAQNGELWLYIPRADWGANVLTDEQPQLLAEIRNFYKREAIKRISERTEFWAQQLQLYPSAVKFREQRTRWGSCSSRGTIHFNWRLIVFKPEIIDYVIVHELAHLRYMNHSSQFWSLVESHIGDYRMVMKELKTSQPLCEFLTPRC